MNTPTRSMGNLARHGKWVRLGVTEGGSTRRMGTCGTRRVHTNSCILMGGMQEDGRVGRVGNAHQHDESRGDEAEHKHDAKEEVCQHSATVEHVDDQIQDDVQLEVGRKVPNHDVALKWR